MDTEVVIAVTRAGLGDWLIFDSFEEADEHPLVQYGDVIMTHRAAFMTQWTRLELPGLLEHLGMGEFSSSPDLLHHNVDKVWARMISISARPTEDPSELCELIRRDRRLTKVERKKIMSTASTKTKEDKPKAEKKVIQRRYSGEAKVTLLADKDGNPYGPDNNPKRAGTKTYERFKLYANGLTVEELLAKGAEFGDFKYDEDKGFVKFTEPSV